MSTKIMVVDDEEDLEILMRQKFRKQIKEGVYAFVFARNGKEALQKLEEDQEISIVLTDINMPEMDGLTLLGKLAELNKLMRAVVVSAYGDLANIRTAMNRGAFDFLVKPVDFTDLEITINKTVQHVELLKKAMQDHAQLVALHRELDIAREMQQSILPTEFPVLADNGKFSLYARMIPAYDVGGDFYDFFYVDQDRLGISVADVSGKGIPAALFMMMSRTLLRARALQVSSPAQCLSDVNNILAANNPSMTFVTLFYGILDLNSGEFTYCNGGHNPPYVLRHSGALEELPSQRNMVLGPIENGKYVESTVRLNSADGLFLYSDGVTEAENSDGVFFGSERLEGLLKESNGAAATELANRVITEIHNFAGTKVQSDDITVLALRYQR